MIIYFCFVLIDLINDYKKSLNCLYNCFYENCLCNGFYENCLYNGFYVHYYFLKLFFSIKNNYGNDDFYTNCYF